MNMLQVRYKHFWLVLSAVLFATIHCRAESENLKPEWIKLLERAKTVEIVLLKKDSSDRTKPKELDKKTTDRLKSLLQADGSWGRQNFCEPINVAKLIFHLNSPDGKNENLTLKVCFHCHQISSKHGEKVTYNSNFKPIHAELLKIVRDTFPEDEELGGVK